MRARLLQKALYDDLGLRQLTVNVEPIVLSLTIRPTRGRQEIKAVIGENSVTENASLLDDRRPLALNGRNLKPSPHGSVMLREIAKGGSAAAVR